MNISGLQSLAGFCYQIKVFTLCLAEINENSSVKFENYDDVEVHEKQKVEEILEGFTGKAEIDGSIKLIQVKKTNITSDSHKKIIFNWILATIENPAVSSYQLFTSKKYNNPMKLFEYDCKDLYDEICLSNKNKNALITKVKEKFEDNYEKFERIYNKIKHSHEVINSEDIDSELYNAFKIHLNRAGLTHEIYQYRLEELIRYIQNEILSAATRLKYFSCDYSRFGIIIESIFNSIKKDKLGLNYALFRKGITTDLSDPEVINSREYLQLKACYPEPSKLNRIEKHLVRKQYYEQYRYMQLRNLELPHIERIEELTYDFYEDALDELQSNANGDQPLNRLNNTKKRNSNNEELNGILGAKELNDGVCIYLTKSNIDKELLISWEDEY